MRDTVEGDSVWEQRASSKVMEDIVGGMRDSNRDCVKGAEGLRESSRVQRDSVEGFRDSNKIVRFRDSNKVKRDSNEGLRDRNRISIKGDIFKGCGTVSRVLWD